MTKKDNIKKRARKQFWIRTGKQVLAFFVILFALSGLGHGWLANEPSGLCIDHHPEGFCELSIKSPFVIGVFLSVYIGFFLFFIWFVVILPFTKWINYNKKKIKENLTK